MELLDRSTELHEIRAQLQHLVLHLLILICPLLVVPLAQTPEGDFAEIWVWEGRHGESGIILVNFSGAE